MAGEGRGDAPDGLAIIWHSRTGGAAAMARAALRGAKESAPDTACRLLQADDARHDDLLQSAAYLFVCPENLAAVTGAMKEFFDRCYYPVLGRIEGRPYATAIAAGSDGENATRQIDRIATGWRLKRVADPLIVNFDAQTPEAILAEKALEANEEVRCIEIGAAMASGLAMGIF